MKKKDRWFWVKLFGPGLLAMPYLLDIVFDFLPGTHYAFHPGYENMPIIEKAIPVLAFLGFLFAITYSSFFPFKGNKAVKWLFVIGWILTTDYLFFGVIPPRDPREYFSEFGHWSIATIGLILLLSLYYYQFRNSKIFKNRLLIVRYYALLILFSISIFLMAMFLIREMKLNILSSFSGNFLYGVGGSVLIILIAIGALLSVFLYYFCSIKFHKSPPVGDFGKKIEKIGA